MSCSCLVYDAASAAPAKVEPESEKFIEEQRVLAMLEARGLVAARHKRELEELTVTFIFDHFVADVTHEVPLLP